MDEGKEIMRSQCRELVTKEGDCEPHWSNGYHS